jgi:hypothetical protein
MQWMLGVAFWKVSMAATQDRPQQNEEQSTSSLVVEEGSMTFAWKAENGVQRRAILAWDGKIAPTAFVGGPSEDAHTVCGVSCPTLRFETLNESQPGPRSEVLSLAPREMFEQIHGRCSARGIPQLMLDAMVRYRKAYLAVRRFYPNGSSESGFLGWDERLEDVVAADAAVLQRLGVTHTDAGMRLKEIFDAYWKLHERWRRSWLAGESVSSWSDPVEIDAFLVHRSYCYGFQDCPFEGCEFRESGCAHSNCDFTISDRRGDSAISHPGMIWHLISAHRFFEGKAVPYRAEPEPLVKLLFGS